MSKRGAYKTSAESEYIDLVMQLGCAICRRVGINAPADHFHHPREAQGGAERAPNWCGYGLCYEHHLGDTGVHEIGKAGISRFYKCDELDLIGDTYKLVFEQIKGKK